MTGDNLGSILEGTPKLERLCNCGEVVREIYILWDHCWYTWKLKLLLIVKHFKNMFSVCIWSIVCIYLCTYGSMNLDIY